MKLLRFTVLLVPFFMTGCLEIDTVSKILPDGSIQRSLELRGSESNIMETAFNIPRVDVELWETTQDSLQDDNFLYTATRTFESVTALNESFEANSGPLRFKIKADFKQTEGLFFKRYYYSEKVWVDLPGPGLPVESYITGKEIEALIINDTDEGSGLLDSVEAKRLEDQLDLYLERRIFEDFAKTLREGARRIDALDQVNKILETNSDSLAVKLGTTNYYDENAVWESILEEYLNGELVDAIHEGYPEGFEDFYKRWQFFEEVLMNDYDFSIELPGVIRKTSALDVRGNRMSWEPNALTLFFGGATLEGESSIVRVWSVVITGLLLLLTLVVTIVSFIKQRRSSRLI